nr:MFS transporter [Dactylosporangium thailandense]
MLTRSPVRVRVGFAALMTGTLLAPLNSSMIVVALPAVQQHYRASLTTVSWVVSVFYLTACVAQPVLGRLADAFGPRRVFVAGMLTATVAAAVAPFCPDVGLLVGCRALQAVGVSAAYPCALLFLRRVGATDRLAHVASVNTASGAIGPVLGGLLTSTVGWPAIFWVNLPLTVAAMVTGLAVLGPGQDQAMPNLRATVARMDVPGILAFAFGVAALLDLTLGHVIRGGIGLALGAIAFVWQERRAAHPFIDAAALRAVKGMPAVLFAFLLFNLAYYGAFYGLPQWFQARGFSAGEAGLLMLPIAATGALTTITASRVVTRVSARLTVVSSAILLVVGLAGIAAFGPATPVWLIALDGVVLGLPYGLGNLGLQRLMYERSPRHMTGVVGGLFQSCRYTGAILAIGVVGSLLGAPPGAVPDLSVFAGAMAAVAVVMLVVTVRDLGVRPPAGLPDEAARRVRSLPVGPVDLPGR